MTGTSGWELIRVLSSDRKSQAEVRQLANNPQYALRARDCGPLDVSREMSIMQGRRLTRRLQRAWI